MAALNAQISEHYFDSTDVTNVSTLSGHSVVADVVEDHQMAFGGRTYVDVDESGFLRIRSGRERSSSHMVIADSGAVVGPYLGEFITYAHHPGRLFAHNANRILMGDSTHWIIRYERPAEGTWYTQPREFVSLFDGESTVGESLAFSPFDYLDSENARDARAEIDSVLLLPRNDAQSIHSRLLEKLEISIEEPDLRVMSRESVRFFVEFLTAYPNIRSPLIFLRSSGEVKATWRVSEREILSIDFGADGTAEYIAFAPNRRRPTVTQVSSADGTSWRDVLRTLSQGSNIDWIWDTDD